MTPAEAKCIIEALGVTHDQVAEQAGCSSALIYRIVQPGRVIPVPDYVAAALGRLEVSFTVAADRLATEYLSDPEAEHLTRYVTTGTFWSAVPEMAGWPMQSQGPLLAEVRRRMDQHPSIEWESAA